MNMTRNKLQISESGYVYIGAPGKSRRGPPQHRNVQMLGHISTLLKERSSRGRLVRLWWQHYLSRVRSECIRPQEP